MADHHHIESPDGQHHLVRQLAVLDEQLIALWHTRTRMAAQLLTSAQLATDRAAARQYARRLGLRVGAGVADLLRVHAAAYRGVRHAVPRTELEGVPLVGMYTVDVYTGRKLTDPEIAALGAHYTPAANGHLRGTLRLAASSPQMAAATALDVVRDRTGVEAVVEVQPPVTWAGPVEE